MNTAGPIVLSKVVANDLCIGCGACAHACPSKALEIKWNKYGFLVAAATGQQCETDGACIRVCPFNPDAQPGENNEDTLAGDFLAESPLQGPRIGRYHKIYVGFSQRHRVTSSSGGIATFVYEKLFDRGAIAHVITVGSASKSDAHYEYRIVSSKEELHRISRTRYHPVTLFDALERIKALEGGVAISGVGCFIKAIRLAQNNDPILKEKVTFLLGIICGGVKSKFFTDYLATRAGAPINAYSEPEYRVKNPQSTASDYSFSCRDSSFDVIKIVRMKEVGDMWGTGLFKANACDFCDDVTTELADISLGDAWLDPFNRDGNGHNVIVTRSALADQILLAGKHSKELTLEDLSLGSFLASQQGSFTHRHDAIGFRIALARRVGFVVPPKRFGSNKLPLHLQIVQRLRMAARARSLTDWFELRDPVRFDKSMRRTLAYLRVATRFARLVRKINRITGKYF